ncbi:MAG: hypothetical protein J7L03_05940 [Caldisericaceae bacterium]|nr:hypothetical protein [Caldisericaceae bacterium]
MTQESKTNKKSIDALINKLAYDFVQGITDKKHLNEIDKALGVLSNDGVYAYFVYVEAKGIGDIFLNKIKSLIDIVEINKDGKKIEELNQDYFQKLSEDLNSLLFFRDILEKILIYARYHAKALGEKNE